MFGYVRMPALVVLSMALAVGACERAEQPPAETERPAETAPTPSPEPTVRDMPAETGPIAEATEEVEEAREDFAEGETDDAAEDFREAAGDLRREAEGADAEVRQDLSTVADRLEGLADDVEAGTVTTLDEMDRELAAVHQALARRYHTTAEEAWARRDVQEAGRNLNAAADQVELAARRAGQDIDESTAAAVRDAKEVGRTLAQDADWTESEAEQAMQALGREIDRMEERLPHDD